MTPAHGHSQTPQSVSQAAAARLSPAFPERAPWGTAARLRAWQAEALEQYARTNPRDFLAVATPGAGKTTFALQIAAQLLSTGVVSAITVVTPTEHLKTQWADAAARVGIHLDPAFRNSQRDHARSYDGIAVTYAGVAADAALHARRTRREPTLVIMDEIHHGADALSWGDGLQEAFGSATRRLCLTGTPFRSDTNAIPFVTYAPDAHGIRRSVADYSYAYGDALRDGVVRPVIFLSYAGQMRWRTRAGDEVAVHLGDPLTKDLTAQAWRTALDPAGDWISSVLRAADTRLTELRRTIPDAAGLVIATDQAHARGYADVLRQITGHDPVVVVSDEPGSSQRIEKFAASTEERWMIAVRMVSEGVDVPRLAVGVYATSAATPLYFAQAVGRFVRARRRGETASVFLPTVPRLLEMAATLELERDHALDRPTREGDFAPEQAELDAAQRDAKASAELDQPGFEALDSTATFDSVLFDGDQYGLQAVAGSDEELDFLGLPGLLDPDQVAELLRKRQADQVKARGRSQRRSGRGTASDTAVPVAQHRQVAELRKELNGLVGAWSKRTGRSHAAIHVELRDRCGGPAVPQADVAHLQARIAVLRNWFVGRSA